MAYARPTLAELVTRIKADVKSQLGATASSLARSWANIFATANAGAHHLLYGYIDWVYRQSFARTAEREALIDKASVYGLTIKPAEYANGYVHVSGIDGSIIPVGTIWKRADGFRYSVDTPITMIGSVTDVHVRATLPGIIGNLASGTPVTLESPLTGITGSAVVAASPTPGAIVAGTDEEDLEVFRARYLRRTRRPPQGGARADYEIWAEEIPGVGRAYSYGSREISGGEDDLSSPAVPPIGEVWVYLETGDYDNPEVSTATRNAVQAYLDVKKSATATVRVFSVTPYLIGLAIEVTPVLGASEAQVKAEINAELKDLYIREGNPGSTLYLSKINEAISNAASEDHHVLLGPTEDIVIPYDNRAVLGVMFVTIV